MVLLPDEEGAAMDSELLIGFVAALSVATVVLANLIYKGLRNVHDELQEALDLLRNGGSGDD